MNDTSRCMCGEKIISGVYIISCERRKMLYGNLDNAVLKQTSLPHLKHKLCNGCIAVRIRSSYKYHRSAICHSFQVFCFSSSFLKSYLNRLSAVVYLCCVIRYFRLVRTKSPMGSSCCCLTNS